jgi:hypothetical protein
MERLKARELAKRCVWRRDLKAAAYSLGGNKKPILELAQDSFVWMTM